MRYVLLQLALAVFNGLLAAFHFTQGNMLLASFCAVCTAVILVFAVLTFREVRS